MIKNVIDFVVSVQWNANIQHIQQHKTQMYNPRDALMTMENLM